jgi:hypothetical protein
LLREQGRLGTKIENDKRLHKPAFGERLGMSDWSLRDEILVATHRWPLIIIFCLLGALAGWGVSKIWPSPHQATAELYVGLNIYRAFEDRNAVSFADGVQFNSPDDYKNWQMSDLNTVIFTDDVVKKTLTQLRQEDDYWQDVTRDELRGMLHVYWRNAGKWLLVAESPSPKYARQAAAAWQNVVVDWINAATASAQETMALDMQLQALANTQTQSSAQLSDLKQVHSMLLDWQSKAGQWATDQPIKSEDRGQLWTLVNRASGNDPAWGSLLNTFPAVDAPAQAYLSWLDQVIPSTEEEITLVQGQIDSFEQERASLVEAYGAASKKSMGLSTNLEVSKVSETQPRQTIVRPTSTLMLIGSVFGLMVLAIIWLIQLTLRRAR